jgi:hypothetical protein
MKRLRKLRDNTRRVCCLAARYTKKSAALLALPHVLMCSALLRSSSAEFVACDQADADSVCFPTTRASLGHLCGTPYANLHVPKRLLTSAHPPPVFSTHFSKIGMRSIAAPVPARAPFSVGTVVLLKEMAVEALNDAYAQIESVMTWKEQSQRAADGVVSQDQKEYTIRLCGGHVHHMGVAESLMKECVFFCLVARILLHCLAALLCLFTLLNIYVLVLISAHQPDNCTHFSSFLSSDDVCCLRFADGITVTEQNLLVIEDTGTNIMCV